MITIADHSLSRLVAQTKPHMGGKFEAEVVQSITLDHDGRHLYAMATNRYTLAVARTQLTVSEGEPWSGLVYRTEIPALLAGIRLLDSKPVTLDRVGSQLILSGPSGSRIAIDLVDAEKPPLDWRKVLLPALEKPVEKSQMALSTRFFGAWKNLPDPVQIWSTGENRMALIVAPDFLGAQMPVRREGEDVALRQELDSWKAAAPALAAA
ncbi:hypothetical protein [Streptomyces sp. NPDC096030]|uniref:hypothetical protein n=1 Tax=Streptomyces sp. NPDC096030 TaxID=3155423 RepID=UPI00332F243E